MAFFKQIQQSIYGPDFYRAMSTVSAKEGFKYYSKLTSIAALVIMVLFAFVFVPVVTVVFSKGNVNKLVSQFPAELTVTVRDGKASTNVAEPYAIVMPPGDAKSAQRQNLVVIDTKASVDVSSLEKYNTAILVTSDYIVGEKSNGQITIQKLKGVPDMTINRQVVSSYAEKIFPYLKFIVPFLLLTVFIGAYLAGFIANLIVLLILTLIVWIVGKIRKTGITYGTYYKLGLYGITPVVILSMISGLINLPWLADWIIFFILFFINTKFVKQPLL